MLRFRSLLCASLAFAMLASGVSVNSSIIKKINKQMRVELDADAETNMNVDEVAFDEHHHQHGHEATVDEVAYVEHQHGHKAPLMRRATPPATPMSMSEESLAE